MTEIERILNDEMALPNINNGNPLHHNNDLCPHQIVILLEVVNDAAPCQKHLNTEQVVIPFSNDPTIQNLKLFRNFRHQYSC